MPSKCSRDGPASHARCSAPRPARSQSSTSARVPSRSKRRRSERTIASAPADAAHSSSEASSPSRARSSAARSASPAQPRRSRSGQRRRARRRNMAERSSASKTGEDGERRSRIESTICAATSFGSSSRGGGGAAGGSARLKTRLTGSAERASATAPLEPRLADRSAPAALPPAPLGGASLGGSAKGSRCDFSPRLTLRLGESGARPAAHEPSDMAWRETRGSSRAAPRRSRAAAVEPASASWPSELEHLEGGRGRSDASGRREATCSMRARDGARRSCAATSWRRQARKARLCRCCCCGQSCHAWCARWAGVKPNESFCCSAQSSRETAEPCEPGAGSLAGAAASEEEGSMSHTACRSARRAARWRWNGSALASPGSTVIAALACSFSATLQPHAPAS
mmetsp:Transcript_37360/g.117481  ORF Transcript_37360/g.117481 Transcript_37360/m.117481 type:complete len:399 (-) Transcript_37360:100-1296(-)